MDREPREERQVARGLCPCVVGDGRMQCVHNSRQQPLCVGWMASCLRGAFLFTIKSHVRMGRHQTSVALQLLKHIIVLDMVNATLRTVHGIQ